MSTNGDEAQEVVDYASKAEIIAKPWWWCALKWYLMSAALIAGGGWFLYDGYVKYPRANEAARQAGRDKMPHSEFDLKLQRLIGYALPPLGIACAIWTAYTSRGQYRLAGNVLHVPGHPPVPVEAIRAIDKRKWDRKGIVYLDYELPDSGKTGRVKLDDYIYEREPTDAILERIEAEVLPDATQEGGGGAVISEPLESREMI